MILAFNIISWNYLQLLHNNSVLLTNFSYNITNIQRYNDKQNRTEEYLYIDLRVNIQMFLLMYFFIENVYRSELRALFLYEFSEILH